MWNKLDNDHLIKFVLHDLIYGTRVGYIFLYIYGGKVYVWVFVIWCVWWGKENVGQDQYSKRERETDVVIGCTKDNKTINMTFIVGRDGLWGNWLWVDVNCVNNFYV